jgi:predicted hydrolase (HD superfamily)
MNRQTGLTLLESWVQSPSLLRHCLTVEQVMRKAATHYGEPGADPEVWGLAGLLHDADWEHWPETHPHRIVDHLTSLGENEIARAIASHGSSFGVPPVSAMDKALFACDELTGFIVACSLMRPDGVLSLEPKKVEKKLGEKKFAAGVDREDIALGVRLLGVELTDHIRFVLEALQEKAEELGVASRS